MSDAAADDLPWPRPSLSPAVPCFLSLYKQNSWSPDAYRDEAWKRRKGSHGVRRRRSKSVTDEDMNELKACIELGFGFDSPEIDHRLSNTLPAYSLYYAVNKQYKDVVCRETSSSGCSECESPPSSSMGSPNPHTMFVGPGENPETVKMRLRRWAQVVACSVRQSSL